MSNPTIAAICFPWTDEPPYPWNPKVRREQTAAYWSWAWGHMTWGGVNAAAMVLGDTDTWRQATRTNCTVIQNLHHEISVMPQIGKAAFAKFAGWNKPVKPDVSRIAAHLAALVSDFGDLPRVRYQGKPVFGVLGNIPGCKDLWQPDTLCKIGWEMQREYGHEPIAWFVGRDLVKASWHHEQQYNPFGPNRYHAEIRGKTAALRPGFWHATNPGARFVPRLKGHPWRAAIKTALDYGCEYLFLESEGEYKEGSSILPCHTQADPGVVEATGHTDTWGNGSRRYLRILKQELSHRNRKPRMV